MKKKTIVIVGLIVAVLLTTALILRPKKVNVKDILIETAKAGLGSINKTITATGTLEALLTVEVGTQVSGIIENIYVDFNTYVKKGQLLAKIDTTNLAAALEQSQATLDNAKAELDYQQTTYDRLAPLNNKKLISQTEYDQAVYNLNKAKASYKSALAQHKKNRINLDYALIYSPIDGIILNRAVEEGQTVAASFNTPTLFTIANDLTQMQVEANVDEADIGQVKKGQRVEFSVDAYPDETFDGEVTEVRLEPTISNNVVTYTIVIAAPNPDYKLMPGMTAETVIYVIEKKNILMVPSKALRFVPEQNLMTSYIEGQEKPEMSDGKGFPETPEGENRPKKPDGQPDMKNMPPPVFDENSDQKMVWVKDGSHIHPVPVKTGLDDDIHVEVISGLRSGDEIIVSMEQKGGNTEDTPKEMGSNPFMPKPPGRDKKK